MSPDRDTQWFTVQVGSRPDTSLGLPREHESEFTGLLSANGFRFGSWSRPAEEDDCGDGGSWTGWIQAGGATASLTAISVTLRTYITRRKNNSVTLWRAGEKHVEIKGDMSAGDIAKIINAQNSENLPEGRHDDPYW